MTPSTRRLAWAFVLVLLAALLASSPASASPSSSSKRIQADRVLAQIQSLDASLGRAVDAYNAAQMRLDEIREEQRVNRRHLEIARGNFTEAQTALQERLRTLYTSEDAHVVDILLGAKNLDDLLARVEAVDRISEHDTRIIREIRTYRAEVRRREKELAQANAEQAEVVAERERRRAAIETQLAERQRLLASIKEEIKRIEAAEAARQRRLEAQARARLRQQQSDSNSESSSDSSPDSDSSSDSGSEPAAAPSSGGSSGGGGGGGSAGPARYGGVVGIAMQYLGVPYRWGGASPSTGFDCSGFVMYVYAQVGVSLPHNAAAQYGYGSPVSRSDLQPGDLVFFNGLGHNGIYIGGNQFIHSPHTGDVVKISSISGWYADTWVGARRL